MGWGPPRRARPRRRTEQTCDEEIMYRTTACCMALGFFLFGLLVSVPSSSISRFSSFYGHVSIGAHVCPIPRLIPSKLVYI